nr:hypothetical protein [Tanacetum cinerariifolium]
MFSFVVLAEKRCQTVASLNFIINAWLQKALEDLVVEMDAMKKKEEESQATILSLQTTLANT